MKIYGYKKRIINKDGLLSLREIAIQASPANLRRVAAFLMKAADAMEKMKKGFGHLHYKDSQARKKKNDPDIIVAR